MNHIISRVDFFVNCVLITSLFVYIKFIVSDSDNSCDFINLGNV